MIAISRPMGNGQHGVRDGYGTEFRGERVDACFRRCVCRSYRVTRCHAGGSNVQLTLAE